jgi:serine phosphatase RsbU (regulator of sigma subunit)
MLIGAAAFGLGIEAESVIIAAVGGDSGELQWISDSIVAVGVATTTYLWLSLRASRTLAGELERQRIALDTQLRLAADIQRSLLPELPASIPGFRLAARLVPAGHVGGDFYDFLGLPDGALLLVGDVSGKGVPAALVQATIHSLFRLLARETQHPAEIAARLSTELHSETGGAPYATAVVLRLYSSPLRLVCVNAGHPPLLLRSAEGIVELAADGVPLGLLPGASYLARVISLAPGTLGLVVTDGISEALEGVPRSVAEALRDCGPEPAPSEVCERLMAEAARAPGPPGVKGWQDDRTALAFQVVA